jgi:hypothetical protein
MSRFRLLSDAQWSLIVSMLPLPTGRRGRPFADARTIGRSDHPSVSVRAGVA